MLFRKIIAVGSHVELMITLGFVFLAWVPKHSSFVEDLESNQETVDCPIMFMPPLYQ